VSELRIAGAEAEDERTRAASEFCLFYRDHVEGLLERIRLGRRKFPRLILRAILPALLVWLPLLLLDAADSGGRAVPLIKDFSFHVRFLFIVPLLILIGPPIDIQTRMVALRFASNEMIPPENKGRFVAAVWEANHLIRAWWVLVLAILGTFAVVAQPLIAGSELHGLSEGFAAFRQLSVGGWWYLLGSTIPVFLYVRWTWRYIVWTWFLFRVSRLDLKLVPAHPDRSAGLGFVGIGHTMFAFVGMALSASIAAAAATRIVEFGETVMSYKFVLAAVLVVLVGIGAIPLLVFVPDLAKARRIGLLRHSQFSTGFIKLLDRKADEQGAAAIEGNDIQSLADLGGSFERIEGMRMMPIDPRGVKTFLLAIAIPLVLLVLTTVPTQQLVELLKKAMG